MVQPINVKRIHPDAKLPTYATTGAACFDLHACDIKRASASAVVKRCVSVVYGTGLTVEIPSGYCMKIYSRSGHGFNHDTRLANCVGVIDSDYRGEIMVKLTCDSWEGVPELEPGDRIAQAEIVPVTRVSFVEVDTLSDTERGTGGFGSTGK